MKQQRKQNIWWVSYLRFYAAWGEDVWFKTGELHPPPPHIFQEKYLLNMNMNMTDVSLLKLNINHSYVSFHFFFFFNKTMTLPVINNTVSHKPV